MEKEIPISSGNTPQQNRGASIPNIADLLNNINSFNDQLQEASALAAVTSILSNWKQYCEQLKLEVGPPNPEEENCSCCVLDLGVRFRGWRKNFRGHIIGEPMTTPNAIVWVHINYHPKKKCADVSDDGAAYDTTNTKRFYRTHAFAST